MRDLSTICRRLLNLTVVFLALSSQVFAQSTVVKVHIPSKPLADALIDLAEQA